MYTVSTQEYNKKALKNIKTALKNRLTLFLGEKMYVDMFNVIYGEGVVYRDNFIKSEIDSFIKKNPEQILPTYTIYKRDENNIKTYYEKLFCQLKEEVTTKIATMLQDKKEELINKTTQIKESICNQYHTPISNTTQTEYPMTFHNTFSNNSSTYNPYIQSSSDILLPENLRSATLPQATTSYENQNNDELFNPQTPILSTEDHISLFRASTPIQETPVEDLSIESIENISLNMGIMNISGEIKTENMNCDQLQKSNISSSSLNTPNISYIGSPKNDTPESTLFNKLMKM